MQNDAPRRNRSEAMQWFVRGLFAALGVYAATFAALIVASAFIWAMFRLGYLIVPGNQYGRELWP